MLLHVIHLVEVNECNTDTLHVCIYQRILRYYDSAILQQLSVLACARTIDVLDGCWRLCLCAGVPCAFAAKGVSISESGTNSNRPLEYPVLPPTFAYIYIVKVPLSSTSFIAGRFTRRRHRIDEYTFTYILVYFCTVASHTHCTLHHPACALFRTVRSHSLSAIITPL